MSSLKNTEIQQIDDPQQHKIKKTLMHSQNTNHWLKSRYQNKVKKKYLSLPVDYYYDLNLKQLFDCFDSNGNEYLEGNELYKIFTHLKIPVTKEQCIHLFQLAGKKDLFDKMNFQEFKNCFNNEEFNNYFRQLTEQIKEKEHNQKYIPTNFMSMVIYIKFIIDRSHNQKNYLSETEINSKIDGYIKHFQNQSIHSEENSKFLNLQIQSHKKQYFHKTEQKNLPDNTYRYSSQNNIDFYNTDVYLKKNNNSLENKPLLKSQLQPNLTDRIFRSNSNQKTSQFNKRSAQSQQIFHEEEQEPSSNNLQNQQNIQNKNKKISQNFLPRLSQCSSSQIMNVQIISPRIKNKGIIDDQSNSSSSSEHEINLQNSQQKIQFELEGLLKCAKQDGKRQAIIGQSEKNLNNKSDDNQPKIFLNRSLLKEIQNQSMCQLNRINKSQSQISISFSKQIQNKINHSRSQEKIKQSPLQQKYYQQDRKKSIVEKSILRYNYFKKIKRIDDMFNYPINKIGNSKSVLPFKNSLLSKSILEEQSQTHILNSSQNLDPLCQRHEKYKEKIIIQKQNNIQTNYLYKEKKESSPAMLKYCKTFQNFNNQYRKNIKTKLPNI